MYLSSVYGEGGIEAHVVLASEFNGTELWTIETKAPKFIDAEFRTHRILSQNSSSSRAIPFEKLADGADFFPFDIREAEKGMQGYKNIDEENGSLFLRDLEDLKELALNKLAVWKDKIHKQHLNRYLEPWSWQKKVITGTEWKNFFELRLAPGAQPEIQELARCMEKAMKLVSPKNLEPGQWHLPYVDEVLTLEAAKKCSVARCARVSYMTHDNKNPSVENDLKLYEHLLFSKHMTPFEHQATPMNEKYTKYDNFYDWTAGITHEDRNHHYWSGNFREWIQHRQLVNEWNG